MRGWGLYCLVDVASRAGEEAPSVRTSAGYRLAVHARRPGLYLAGAALGLSLFRIGAKSLWHDEVFSIAIARFDFSSLGTAIRSGEAFSGLYYLILHAWALISSSEVWIRIPSAFFGAGSVYALYTLTCRLFGTRTAMVAGTLMTANAFFIQYAQEARSYSLVLLATILSSYLFVRAVEESTVPHWLTYSAVSGIAVYAHPFALLLLVGHLVSLVFLHPRPPWKHLAATYGGIAIVVAPLMLLILSGDPLHRSFASGASLGALKSLFLNLTGSAEVPGGVVILLAYFGVCSVGLIRIAAKFRNRIDSRRSWHHAYVLCWLLVPIAMSLATSVVRPNLVPRYLIVVLPALLLLASIGLTQFGARIAIGATVALVGLGLYSLGYYYSADFKNGENWRAAVASVAERARPGDGVIFFSHLGRQPFEYYLASTPEVRRKLVPVYPGDRWSDYLPVLGEFRLESTEQAAGELRSLSRVWTVFLWFPNNHDDVAPVDRILSRDFVETYHKYFGTELQVRLSERRPSSRIP